MEGYVEVTNPREPVYNPIGKLDQIGEMFVNKFQSMIFQLSGQDKVSRTTWCIENQEDDHTANVKFTNMGKFDAATVRVEFF